MGPAGVQREDACAFQPQALHRPEAARDGRPGGRGAASGGTATGKAPRRRSDPAGPQGIVERQHAQARL